MILDESNSWSVTGVRIAEAFFRGVPHLVPDATHMFLEGSPAPDILSLIDAAADATPYRAPAGTKWSWPRKSRRFSVRASEVLFQRLSEAAARHAEPEVCDHVHFYRDGVVLLQWFDAFSEPILISRTVPRRRVERFCAEADGRFWDDPA